jgi:hypothetical protein
MIIPAPDEAVAITLIFHKPLSLWTRDDRAAILQRLEKLMLDPKTLGKRRRKRRKVTK